MKLETISWAGPALVTWLLVTAGWPGLALADESSAVEDVIVLLQERGVIEGEDAARMVERNRAYENKKSWTDRLTFFGDFRARFDGEWFERDPLGNKHSERNRLRYRFRFGRRQRAGDPPGTHRAFPEDLPKRIATHRNPLSESTNAHIRRLYAADILSLDDPLDRLVTAMRTTRKDPIVIVTADHGESGPPVACGASQSGG